MLGFSTITISNYPFINWNEILKQFDYFDISPNQTKLFSQNQVYSLQSIFFNRDISKCSLVRSKNEFENLKVVFADTLEYTNENNIKSLIWGAPSTRNFKTVKISTAFSRASELINMANYKNIKLYFEALPLNHCDFLNSHSELIELHNATDNGGIHYDSCSGILANETVNFLKENISCVERFHLSDVNYGISVLKELRFKAIYNVLKESNIKGTIEIQDFSTLDTSMINMLITDFIKNINTK